MLGALSIKPFERSRPWLRRTRALWGFNKAMCGCGGALRVCGRVATDDVEKGVVVEEASLLAAVDGEEREDTAGLQVPRHPRHS